MPRIHAPYRFSYLDMAQVCENWDQNDSGTDVRMVNKADAVKMLCNTLNRLLARYPRIMWSQGYCLQDDAGTPITDAPDDSSSSDPLMVSTYYDGVANGRKYVHRILSHSRNAGTGNAYLEDDVSGETTPYNDETLTQLYPCELFFDSKIRSTRGAATDAEVEAQVNSYNGYTIMDIVCQDESINTLDSDTHDAVDPSLVTSGDLVLADVLEDIRSKFHSLRTENLPVVLDWHAYAVGGTWQTSASINELVIGTTSTSYGNILDTSVTSRTTTSPGVTCPAQYCGRGNLSAATAAVENVRLQWRVFGSAATANGTVKIIGPDHVAGNNDEITISSGGAPAWCGTRSNYISLNAGAADTETGTEQNKVDIHFKVAAGGTVYIYAIIGWLEFV